MTVPSIAAVGSRIGQIQGEFQRNMPAAGSFADALDAAQQPDGAVARFAVTPMASPAATVETPVGILGTPIIVQGQMAGTIGDDSWVERLPANGRDWVAAIESAAHEAGLDPRLLAAMVWQESGFRPDAVSRSGAIGLAQLMPGTAEGLGVDPWDPQQNLEGGARYLAWTIEEFGSIELGLAAYNAGPGRVREADGIPNIAETQAYVPRVLEYFRQLGGIA